MSFNTNSQKSQNLDDLPLNLCMKDDLRIHTNDGQSQSQRGSFSTASASEEKSLPGPGDTTGEPYRAVLKTKRCLLISIAASDENGEAADLDLDLEEIKNRLTVRTNSGASTSESNSNLNINETQSAAPGASTANSGSNSAFTQKKEFLGGLIRTGNNNKVEINIHVTKPLCPDCHHYQNFQDGQEYYSQFTNQEDVDAELYYPNYNYTAEGEAENDASAGDQVEMNSSNTREFSYGHTPTHTAQNQKKPAQHQHSQLSSRYSNINSTAVQNVVQDDLDQSLIQTVGKKPTSASKTSIRFQSSSASSIDSIIPTDVAFARNAGEAGVGLPVSQNILEENFEEVSSDFDGSEDPHIPHQAPTALVQNAVPFRVDKSNSKTQHTTDKNRGAKRTEISESLVCIGTKIPQIRVADCQIHPTVEQAKYLTAIKKRSQNHEENVDVEVEDVKMRPSSSKVANKKKASQIVGSKQSANLRTEDLVKMYRAILDKKTKITTYYCKKPNCNYTASGSVTVYTKLRMHYKDHQSPHLFKCKICGNRYRYTFSLNRHMRDSHSPEEREDSD